MQEGIFGPDPKLFHEPGTAVVLAHGVEAYWYAGPTMFLGCYLAESGSEALTYNGAHSGESFRTSKFEASVEEVDAAIALLELADSRTSFSPDIAWALRSSSIIKEQSQSFR